MKNIVITGGAGRVAEVSARFTLDAMPGKQLSIDADLNTQSIISLILINSLTQVISQISRILRTNLTISLFVWISATLMHSLS